MNSYALFSDVSLSPIQKLGIGAYLIIPYSTLATAPDSLETLKITERIVMKKFKNTSSTELEVKTVLWALADYKDTLHTSGQDILTVYSDSQCISGLMKRRSGLVHTDFHGKKSNRLLKNASLYRMFYGLLDEIDFKVVKVRGHSRSDSHDTVHRIFSIVDRKVRHELKVWIKSLNNANLCTAAKQLTSTH
jgi:ribonuclease HI